MIEVDHFEIRTDVIYHYYNKGYFDPEIPIDIVMNRFVGDFLADAGMAENTSDLYRSFIARHKFGKDLEDKLPDKDQWLNESFLTYDCCREMVRQMERWPDITSDIKLKYQLFNRNIYYFFELEFPISPVRGVILNQRVLVDRVKYPSVYRRLFAYIYSKCETPREFIQYHLEKSFDSNLLEYKMFLYSVERDNMDFISPGKRLWDECISQLLSTENNSLGQTTPINQTKKKNNFISENFESMLRGDGQLLMPYLKANFTKANPQNLVDMVMALIELEFLAKSILTNQASLHRTLIAAFGDYGRYASLNSSILTSNNPDRKETIKTLTIEFQREIKKVKS